MVLVLAVLVVPAAFAQTADFVSPGADPATYVHQYLTQEEFWVWYDTYYEAPIYESLGLTPAEYDALAAEVAASACGPGSQISYGQCTCGANTTMVDGQCVADKRTPPGSEGLFLGFAAAGGFAAAIGVVLVLWLPSRIRRRLRQRQNP